MLPDTCSTGQIQDNDLLQPFWVQERIPTFSPKSHHWLRTLPPLRGTSKKALSGLILLCGLGVPALHDTPLQEQSPGVYTWQQKGSGAVEANEYSIRSNDLYEVTHTFLHGKHGFQKIKLRCESVFDWLSTPTRRKLQHCNKVATDSNRACFLTGPVFLSWSSAWR